MNVRVSGFGFVLRVWGLVCFGWAFEEFRASELRACVWVEVFGRVGA